MTTTTTSTANGVTPAAVDNALLPAVSGPINLASTIYRRSPVRALRKQIDAQIGKTPESIVGALQMLVAECDLRAYDWRTASAWWGRAYYLLGAPAALLATVAGATALSDSVPAFVISVLALASAGLTTLVTFLNTNGNRDRNLDLSAAWSELADDVRVQLLEYADKRCAAGSVEDFALRSRYSHIIVELNKRKAKLLRGEVPDGDEAAQSANAS